MVIMQEDFLLEKDIKFVAIGDIVCAIAINQLMADQRHVFRVFEITQDYIESLPPATRNTDHVDYDFLATHPIVLLESALHDGRYFRWDGRHRLHTAWRKYGLKMLPAIYIPRLVWAEYIIGYRSGDRAFGGVRDEYTTKYEEQPYIWNRSPLVPDGKTDHHFEWNFPLSEDILG